MSSPCGTCRRATKRAGNKYYPFCSERCQMADLGRWLNEDYRIPDLTTPVDPQSLGGDGGGGSSGESES